MLTITDITLNQINAALFSLKKDIDSVRVNVLQMKNQINELEKEIEILKSNNTVAEPSVVMMSEEEPTVEE